MSWCRVVFAFLTLLCMGIISCGFVFAADTNVSYSAQMARLQSAYENGLEKMDAERGMALNNLQRQYTNGLATLQRKIQASGNFDGVVIIRKEWDRFTSNRTLEEKDISQDSLELSKLQNDYLKAIDDFGVVKAKGILKLAQQYDKSLETLQQNLTKRGDTTSAIEVKNARESLNKRTEVAQAGFIVAEAESKKPAETQPQQPAPTPVKTAGKSALPNKPDKAAEAAGAAKKKYTGKTSNYVKQRFIRLYETLAAEDAAAARELVDQEYLQNVGAAEVDRQLNFIFGFVTIMKRSAGVKVDAMRIKVDDKEETATLVPKLWYYNKWNEQATMYWMQVDGDWYLDIATDIKKGAKTREFRVPGWHYTIGR